MVDESLTGILLLTHGRQGECLLETVSHLLAEVPPHVVTISLLGTERRSEIEQRSRVVVTQLIQSTGRVIILSDLFGSTQASVAEKIAAESAVTVCAHGVNLAMLLEAIGCRMLPLKVLQKQIIAAGKQAIIRGDNRHA